MEEDLTSTTVPSLLAQALVTMDEQKDATCIVAELAKVDMIDSQGLNFLIGLHRECGQRGMLFRISGASEMNMRLFDMVSLGEHLRIA